MGGRLKEIIEEWVGITKDPFVLIIVQGHLSQFNHKHPIMEAYSQV